MKEPQESKVIDIHTYRNSPKLSLANRFRNLDPDEKLIAAGITASALALTGVLLINELGGAGQSNAELVNSIKSKPQTVELKATVLPPKTHLRSSPRLEDGNNVRTLGDDENAVVTNPVTTMVGDETWIAGKLGDKTVFVDLSRLQTEHEPVADYPLKANSKLNPASVDMASFDRGHNSFVIKQGGTTIDVSQVQVEMAGHDTAQFVDASGFQGPAQ